MKFSDILADLTRGEFRQYSIGGADTGTILPASYPEIASSMMLGLTALHTRFPLRKNNLSVTRMDGTASYLLQPANDNLLKVEFVLDSTGTPLSLEKPREDGNYAMLIPDYRTLWFGPGVTETEFTVTYRADHPALTITEATDATAVAIELPPSHRQALLFYIAYRMLSPLDRADGSSLGATFYAKYKTELQELEQRNVSPETTDNRVNLLEINGWP